MNRVQTISPDNASAAIAPLYDAVKAKLGLVPNMVQALGNSAASLQAYLGFSGALTTGALRPSTREKIALLTAERNECEYCLRAHTAIGGLLKIPSSDLVAARRGLAEDQKEQALLDLAAELIETRGAVADSTYEKVLAAGVTAEEAVEVVANVALNYYTNVFNRFANPAIEFPRVEPLEAAVN
jgi:uncharacterized peroxidase-related enzyme